MIIIIILTTAPGGCEIVKSWETMIADLSGYARFAYTLTVVLCTDVVNRSGQAATAC